MTDDIPINVDLKKTYLGNSILQVDDGSVFGVGLLREPPRNRLHCLQQTSTSVSQNIYNYKVILFQQYNAETRRLNS